MSDLDREQPRITDSTAEVPGISTATTSASWYDHVVTDDGRDAGAPACELEPIDDGVEEYDDGYDPDDDVDEPVRGRARSSRHALAALVCLVVGLLAGAGGLATYSWWTKPLPMPPAAAAVPPTPPRPNAGAVRTQLRDIAEYQAAQADYKTQVPIGNNGGLGRQITGDSAVLDATGRVNATVDLSNLGEDAVKVSPDGKTVTITLPHARIGEASIDYNRTQVTQRQRGIWTRVTGKELDAGAAYNQAGSNIKGEAEKSDLRQRAEENTRAMLTGLLKSLGFEHVEVRFEDPKG